MGYIEIKDLTYYYPKDKGNDNHNNTPALKDVQLTLNKGDILLVLGKSGSGKSTLAKAIVGSVPHFYGGSIKGSITVGGKNLEELQHFERAEEVTMVFQDPEKQLMMNKVHREIAFGLENIGSEEKTIKRRVWEAMEFTNILHLAHRDINTLSGGEKQKVAITSALSYLPKCIILDEPLSQLDPLAAEEIVSLIKKINEELGITIIIIEQRINPWFQTADKIALMDQGSLKLFETKEEFSFACSEDNINFLPDYVRIFKLAENKFIPKNFKEARNFIEKFYNETDLLNIKTPRESQWEISKNKEDGHKELIVNVHKVKSFYGENEAIKNISLKINKGDFISIMGANGAGKSTFLKTLIGLQPYTGNIKVFEKEVKKTSVKEIARHIGYVSQNPNDYISKDTVFEELKFTMDNFQCFDEEYLDRVLNDLDILPLKYKNPRDLSGGEKQRVAIASILVNTPRILILDEPTRGIDIHLKHRLGEMLKALQKSGVTIIVVTHDVEFSSLYSDKLMLMFNGEVICEGDVSEVISDGIYYTTCANKLFRNKNKSIYTINQGVNALKNLGGSHEEA
ncbi:energy-coupling factor transport system ATP-binding protein [Clostridium amylolyticum]|uniref:Energy-coupling factor transport system ATP-binding protein n=1 Tax=Clostridium amylolyticum TaxID=1121298 RepID=A0A1M6NQS7_9CLOT|nr:ABC transporter ATP-binding protein [Clostridium amylolyticum]SHJ98055.1 energy-coupling factor transport system ATP-binding protein [Clostridium amylolyticum]